MKITIDRLKDTQAKANNINGFLDSEFYILLQDLENIGIIKNLYRLVWGNKCNLEQSLDEQILVYDELLESDNFDKTIEEFGISRVVTYIKYIEKVSNNLSDLYKLENKWS